MDKKITELRTKMAEVNSAIKVIEKKAEDEKRDLLPDESQKCDELDNEFEKLHADLQRREASIERDRLLAAPVNPQTNVPERRASVPTGAGREDHPELTEEQRKENAAEQTRVFDLWMRGGMDALSHEERSFFTRTMRSRERIDRRELPPEYRDQSVGTGSAGGFLVPQGFSGELESALKAFGGMRQVSRAFPTPSGNDIPWPTVDDTANTGELLAENTTAANQDVAFGQVILKAYKYSSKLVPVPIELLQDSFFDVGGLLREKLVERIGRITNTHFTTGTGTGQPKGVVTEAGSGKVGTTGQTLTVIYDDIIDLEHSVDPAYRQGSAYMLNDSSLKVIKKIKDSTGRPLWLPGLASSLADKINGPTLNGYPYVINQDIAVMAANAKSILFGNFSKYIVRDVMAITLLRLEERYAEKGQVGFIAFSRHDGRSVNAAALKYYQNSAT